MARIAVFDSGLGSLSVVGELRRAMKAEIIYLADGLSYPYGMMSQPALERAVRSSIDLLQSRFDPEVIVMGSNTPSLLVPDVIRGNVVGILPPVREAVRASKTRSVAVLATRSAAKSRALVRHIISENPDDMCDITRINASVLVDLVERGLFITRYAHCKRIVCKTLARTFARKTIDVATLSSTHLPLLLPMLQDALPHVTFVDPAKRLAQRIASAVKTKSDRPSLRIYATGDARRLQSSLTRLGYRNKVLRL